MEVDDIELALKVVALQDLIRRAEPWTQHEQQKASDGVWRCVPGCLKCLIRHALSMEN